MLSSSLSYSISCFLSRAGGFKKLLIPKLTCLFWKVFIGRSFLGYDGPYFESILKSVSWSFLLSFTILLILTSSESSESSRIRYFKVWIFKASFFLTGPFDDWVFKLKLYCLKGKVNFNGEIYFCTKLDLLGDSFE